MERPRGPCTAGATIVTVCPASSRNRRCRRIDTCAPPRVPTCWSANITTCTALLGQGFVAVERLERVEGALHVVHLHALERRLLHAQPLLGRLGQHPRELGDEVCHVARLEQVAVLDRKS